MYRGISRTMGIPMVGLALDGGRRLVTREPGAAEGH